LVKNIAINDGIKKNKMVKVIKNAVNFLKLKERIMTAIRPKTSLTLAIGIKNAKIAKTIAKSALKIYGYFCFMPTPPSILFYSVLINYNTITLTCQLI
jgi:hypothetical protein